MALPGDPKDSTSHRVSLSQGPAYQSAFFGSIEPSDCMTCERMRQAVENMKGAWNRLSANHLRRMADPSVPEAQRLRSSAQFARKSMENAQESYEGALKAALDHQSAVTKELRDLLTPPASAGRASIAAEVRQTLRTADESTRAEILQSDDPAVLHAVASAPAGLSSIGPDVHRQMRDKFLEKTAPGLVAKHNALEAAMGELDRAKRTLRDHAESLVDFESADAYEELARETA